MQEVEQPERTAFHVMVDATREITAVFDRVDVLASKLIGPGLSQVSQVEDTRMGLLPALEQTAESLHSRALQAHDTLRQIEKALP
jgi:hypothetical protein